MTDTFWNGMKTPCKLGTAVVADAPEFPLYWARDLIGERIEVVEVQLEGVNQGGGVMYLDNRDDQGRRKVVYGQGMPFMPHKELGIEPDSFQEDENPEWTQ